MSALQAEWLSYFTHVETDALRWSGHLPPPASALKQPGASHTAPPQALDAAQSTVHGGQLLVRAKKKFDKLDADGNGVLEGAEIVALSDWLWSMFHPGGVPLTEEAKAEQGAKLMKRLDANGDGVMDFDEFAGWFSRTCESIEQYRQKTSRKAQQKCSAAEEQSTAASNIQVLKNCKYTSKAVYIDW